MLQPSALVPSLAAAVVMAGFKAARADEDGENRRGSWLRSLKTLYAQDEDEDSVAFPPDGEAGEEGDEEEMEVALDTGTVFNVSVIKGDESLVCVPGA